MANKDESKATADGVEMQVKEEVYAMDEDLCKVGMVVDKKKNVIVALDAPKEVVDLLFGFLALPMGTIVHLLDKVGEDTSFLGGFSNLYKTVRELDSNRFTLGESGKSLFVKPRHKSEEAMRNLNFVLDGEMKTNASMFTFSKSCLQKYTFFPGLYFCSECKLALEPKVMPSTTPSTTPPPTLFKADGISSFHIYSNLEVRHSSIAELTKRATRLGIDLMDLDEREDVDVTRKQFFRLLRCLFSSSAPLTDAFMDQDHPAELQTFKPPPTDPSKEQKDKYTEEALHGRQRVDQEVAKLGKSSLRLVTVTLKDQPSRVLFAEANQPMVDQFLLFLATPLETFSHLTKKLINHKTHLKSLVKSLRTLRGQTKHSPCPRIPWIYSFTFSLIKRINSDPSNFVGIEKAPSLEDAPPVPSFTPAEQEADGTYRPTPPDIKSILKPGPNHCLTDELRLSPTRGFLATVKASLSGYNIALNPTIQHRTIEVDGDKALVLLAATLLSPSISSVYAFLGEEKKNP